MYILLCRDKSYYTGVTSNLEQRQYKHQNSFYDSYTSKRLPVKLVFSQEFANFEEAVNSEKQIKGWSKAKKAALISGDFDLIHELAKCRNESKSR